MRRTALLGLVLALAACGGLPKAEEEVAATQVAVTTTDTPVSSTLPPTTTTLPPTTTTEAPCVEGQTSFGIDGHQVCAGGEWVATTTTTVPELPRDTRLAMIECADDLFNVALGDSTGQACKDASNMLSLESDPWYGDLVGDCHQLAAVVWANIALAQMATTAPPDMQEELDTLAQCAERIKQEATA